MNLLYTTTLFLALFLVASSGFSGSETKNKKTTGSEDQQNKKESDRRGPSNSTEDDTLTSKNREGYTLPDRLRLVAGNWKTDWNKRTIEYHELLSGGPPRDGIPSIDKPVFVTPEHASAWLNGNEPVISFVQDGEARAYPLQILIWHEIVNDTVAGTPVLVTFCPLCNSSLVFDRRVGGDIYSFGTSGLLRNSDLVMYDRTTESLWQQLTGEGIVGVHAGDRLAFLPSSLVGFDEFREQYPGGKVLSRETGFRRPYGENPYVGYDRIGQSPFLFTGSVDDRLSAMERVVAVTVPTGDGPVDIAYPYSVLASKGVVNDKRGETALVLFFEMGTLSALDARMITESRDVGSANVFSSSVDGRTLTFMKAEDGTFVDRETKSRWNFFGMATDGPLKGSVLDPMVHGNHFWFAWAAFKQDTIVYTKGDSKD